MTPKKNAEDKPIAYVWESDLKLYQKLFPYFYWKPQLHISELYQLLQEESKKETSSVALVYLPIVTVPLLSQRGWLSPLEKDLSEKEMDHYLPLALRLLTEDGHIFGVPEDINPFGFFVNNHHRLRNKISIPSTWNELLAVLSKLQNDYRTQGLQIKLNARYDNHALMWSLFHSIGIEARSFELDFLFYQKRIAEVFQFMLRLKELENVIPLSTVKEYSKGKPIEGQPADPIFYCGWLKDLPSSFRYSMQTQLIPFPKGSCQGVSAIPVSGAAWVVPKSCAHKALAVKTIMKMHKVAFAKSNELKGHISFPSLKELWQDKKILKQHPVLHSASVLFDTNTKVTQKFFHSNIITLASSLRSGLFNDLSPEQWTRHLQYSLSGESTKLNNSALQKAVNFIGENLGVLKGLGQISDIVSLSPTHLNRLFKKELGCTCWDYVIQLRMDRSKELILSTPFSIKEISYQMGFKKPSSFTRTFKQYFGINPSSFKSNHLFS